MLTILLLVHVRFLSPWRIAGTNYSRCHLKVYRLETHFTCCIPITAHQLTLQLSSEPLG